MRSHSCTYVTQAWGVHDERWTTALAHAGFSVQSLSLSRDALNINQVNALLASGEGPVLAGPLDSITAHLTTPRPLVGLSWGFDLLDMRERGDDLAWISRLSGLIVDSPETYAIALSSGLEPSRIVTIPWGVDITTFSRNGPIIDVRALGFSETSTLVVTLRAHEPRYRNADVIDGFAKAADSNPSLVLAIGHTGSERALLQERVRELGLQERIRFIGMQSEQELPALLRAAHVYVTASEVDGTSVTLLQAMACGTPVVASDTPGNRAWIEPWVTGRLFPVGDVHELATSLLEATAPATITETLTMAQHARARVEAEADWLQNRQRLQVVLSGV